MPILLPKNEPTFFGEEVNIYVMLNRQYMQEISKVTLSLMYLQFRISEGSIWKYISHQSLQQQQILTSVFTMPYYSAARTNLTSDNIRIGGRQIGVGEFREVLEGTYIGGNRNQQAAACKRFKPNASNLNIGI